MTVDKGYQEAYIGEDPILVRVDTTLSNERGYTLVRGGVGKVGSPRTLSGIDPTGSRRTYRARGLVFLTGMGRDNTLM